MSKQIYKYIVPVRSGNQECQMPVGAKIVHVGMQGRKRIGIWCEVDTCEKCQCSRLFQVYGTGQDIGSGTYLGTVIDIPFVWHVYETTPVTPTKHH